MMDAVITEPASVADARMAAVQAGRWLVILRFRLRPQASPISCWTPCYADLLSEQASDARRLATCRRYFDAVALQIELERWAWEAGCPVTTGEMAERAWRTTERGMALIAIAELLRTAITGLEHVSIDRL